MTREPPSPEEHRDTAPGVSRRDALKGAGVVVALAVYSHSRVGRAPEHHEVASRGGLAYIRPPGAIDEAEFVKRCIRCHKCGENCSNSCIRFVGPEGPPEARGTPYIVPREKACILCMKCNNGCPSGALQAVDPDHPSLWEEVEMGVAAIDFHICASYQHYICGICVRACPLEGEALRAGPWEKPILDASKCVGCGLCEQACVHMPQAIRVRANPSRRLA
ncbi:MAG: 4Fe-4S dicluster domain-containing protein [Polyangiaceae bacterium]